MVRIGLARAPVATLSHAQSLGGTQAEAGGMISSLVARHAGRDTVSLYGVTVIVHEFS